MSEDKTYNGWTNYETWAVGLYLDGNYTGEGTYLDVLEIARTAVADVEATENELHRTDALYALSGALRDYVENDLQGEDGLSGLLGDLLNASLSEVNWQELAEHKLDEIKEED